MSYSLSKSALTAWVFAVTLTAAAGTTSAHDPVWINGGGGSCVSACKIAGGRAVISDQYKKKSSEDQSFTVCRIAHGDGMRVGFNIVSSASGRNCRSEVGGDGVATLQYDCLCIMN
jgi:hypothetical protein